MTKVQRLEREIEQLSPGELAAFRKWFDEYDSVEWDKQIEQDAVADKLDNLAEKAPADHKASRTKELWSTLSRQTFVIGRCDATVFYADAEPEFRMLRGSVQLLLA